MVRAAKAWAWPDCAEDTDRPEMQFADTAVGRIAYQVIGDGPIDLLVNHPPFFPVDHFWDSRRSLPVKTKFFVEDMVAPA